jgi:tRNA uridine 5-carboxymethylaminomethyl modification enzyme
MIDDLVNKSTDEPYRMFTSRAEYRLLLRQDNADRRLSGYGYDLGLISKDIHDDLIRREKLISKGLERFNNFKIHARIVNPFFEKISLPGIDSTETIGKLVKRPEVSLLQLVELLDTESREYLDGVIDDKIAFEQVEIQLKYEGYIKRQQESIERQDKYEETQIPLNLNYLNLKALSTEGKEKLHKVKPRSIGQASRISGVTPSDISVLLVYLKN